MGSTAKGFPYPEPTDPVANTDLAIKALAQFLQDNNVKTIHAGSVVIPLAAAAAGSAAVALPVGKFSAAPIVLLTVIGTSAYFASTTGGPGPTGFSAQIRHYNGTNATVNVTVHYLAVLLG